MRSRSLAAWLLLVLLVSSGPAHLRADEPEAAKGALRPQDEAFFSWWDSLGYPDVGRLPFVGFTTGSWSQAVGERPEPEVEHGFLLDRAEGRIRVFLTDLTTWVLALHSDPEQPWKSVNVEPEDLAAFVTRGLAARRAALDASPRLDAGWEPGEDPFRAHRWVMPAQPWRMLVLARACAAREREDLARSLCDLAFEEEHQRAAADAADLDRHYAQVRRAIASEARVALRESFARTDLSWEDLAQEAERVGRLLAPVDPDAGTRTARMAEELRAIERDVAAPLARRQAQGLAASEPERIADLVALLPTEHERWVRAADGWTQTPPTPEDELVAIGLSAVPALIGALGDERHTRKLTRPVDGNGLLRVTLLVMRVDEVAYEALQRIAAGALPEIAGYPGFPAVGSPEHAALVERVRAWHEQVLARGEIAVLTGIASRGGREAYDAAHRLAELDPHAAVAPVVAGLRAATIDSFRHNLALVLTQLPGEEGREALERLLAPSEDLDVRFTAAQALFQGKPHLAVPVFVEVWRRPLPAPTVLEPDVPGSPAVPDYAAQRRREEALYLLAASGEAPAFDALAEGLDAQSGGERLAVVVALARPDALASFQLLPVGFGTNAVPAGPVTPEAATVLERTLAARLEDDVRVEGARLVVDGTWFDPVIGEVAAWGLARRFPDRWTFDPRATTDGRLRARLTAANAWRAKEGRPPLALPEPLARPEALKPREIAASLQVAAASDDEVARARALAAIGGRGLAALPALREGLREVPRSAPGRAGLDDLARRLSLTVASVAYDADGPPPDAALRDLLDGTIGRSFTGDLYTSIFLHVARHMPPGAEGIRVVALREEPDAGVRLEVELIAERAAASGTQTGWDASGPAVQVGDHVEPGGGSFFSWDHGRDAKAWTDWARLVDRLLAQAGPDDRVRIRARLVGTQ